MKRIHLALVCLLLSACSALPSMQYCDDVSYIRNGNEIHVEATCRAPVGGGVTL